MLEISTSGLMSGDGKRSGPSGLSHRVRPRLYQYGAVVILDLFLLLSLFQPYPPGPPPFSSMSRAALASVIRATYFNFELKKFQFRTKKLSAFNLLA